MAVKDVERVNGHGGLDVDIERGVGDLLMFRGAGAVKLKLHKTRFIDKEETTLPNGVIVVGFFVVSPKCITFSSNCFPDLPCRSKPFK